MHILRRDIRKYFVIGGLLLFAPILFIVRRIRKSYSKYQWADKPGTRIEIPEEVSGQMGFKAAVSPDGKFVVLAGNPPMPPDLFWNQKSGNNEHLLLMALRTSLFFADDSFASFRHISSSHHTSITVAMSVSSGNPCKLASIVREYPFKHPDSYDNLVRMFSTDAKKRMDYTNKMKEVFQRGYEENIYITDLQSGEQKLLFSLFKNRKLQTKTNAFAIPVNGKSIAWNKDCDAVISFDEDNLFRVDAAGKRTDIFDITQIVLCSSLYCDQNDDIIFMGVDKTDSKLKSRVRDRQDSYLFCISSGGEVLKKEHVLFSGTGYGEEMCRMFIGPEFVATLDMYEKNHKDFVLHVIPRLPGVPQTVPEKFGKEFLFEDPNDVDFYYAVYGFLPDSNEILFGKKRLLLAPLTPFTPDNMNAPWVELRRFRVA
jgi:hypothetical protein